MESVTFEFSTQHNLFLPTNNLVSHSGISIEVSDQWKALIRHWHNSYNKHVYVNVTNSTNNHLVRLGITVHHINELSFGSNRLIHRLDNLMVNVWYLDFLFSRKSVDKTDKNLTVTNLCPCKIFKLIVVIVNIRYSTCVRIS